MGRPGRVPRNKFGAKRTELDGIVFDSKGEAQRWAELCLLERMGQISDLKRQVPVTLTAHGYPICRMVLDFQYVENGLAVAEDFKGWATPEWKLKAKLFAAQTGQQIKITGKGKK